MWRSTLDRFEASHPGCPAVKEAVKIGNNIIARTANRTATGPNVSSKETRTRSMSMWTGQRLDVFDLQVGPLTSSPDEREPFLNVFARATLPLSSGLARALTQSIISLTSVKALVVELSPDSWFITSCGFPVIYPFENRGDFPGLKQLDSTPSAGCAAMFKNGAIQCDSFPH